MASGKIYSGNTLCPEINVSAKACQRFQVDNQANSQQTDPSSTSQFTRKITGVHFDDLDYVAFNPIVDPEPGNCFNCWEHGHSLDECSKPKRHDFCQNCGRLDVRVTTCPRCSRAYVGYWKKSRKDDRSQAYDFYDDAAKSLGMEQKKDVNEETKYQMEPMGNDQDEGFSSTESGYCENMVVDEEKRSLKFTGKFLEDFLNLLNAMKHLPMDTQNTVILSFVEDRRELMKEESMATIRIPSISRIWEISQFVGYYLYGFVQNLLSKFMYLKKKVWSY